MEQFVTAIEAMVEAQRRVALLYFEDGSVNTPARP